MSESFDVERAFRGRQDMLLATLTSGRDVISHAPTKGRSAELRWVDMLRQFLPKRYAVDSAFVVDVDGRVSEQMDVVVYDCQYSPLLFQDEAGLYIPAESVYATFDVKQEFSKEHVEYAGGKVASVRALDRTSAEIPSCGRDVRAEGAARYRRRPAPTRQRVDPRAWGSHSRRPSVRYRPKSGSTSVAPSIAAHSKSCKSRIAYRSKRVGVSSP